MSEGRAAPPRSPQGDGSSRVYEEFVKGIWRENPVFVQVLGMCPMLAVTNTAVNGLVMGVTSFSSSSARAS